MLTNELIHAYLARSSTLLNLEYLLNENVLQLRKFKMPKGEVEHASYNLENPRVHNLKNTKKIADLVYPIVKETLGLLINKFPEITLIENNIVKTSKLILTKRPLDVLIPSLVLGSPGLFTMDPSVILSIYGAVGASYLYTNLKRVINTNGNVSVFYPKKTFIKNHNEKNHLAFILAHEMTHSIQDQNHSLYKRIRNAPHKLAIEGLAQVIAYNTCMQLDSEIWDIYKIEANAIATMHSFITLNHLYDQQATPTHKRLNTKVKKFQHIRADNYDLGFIAIDLMRREAGNEILKAIAKGEKINI